MQYADQLDVRLGDAIDDDKWRACYEQLACAAQAAGPAGIRKLSQAFDLRLDFIPHRERGSRLVLRDVFDDTVEVFAVAVAAKQAHALTVAFGGATRKLGAFFGRSFRP